MVKHERTDLKSASGIGRLNKMIFFGDDFSVVVYIWLTGRKEQESFTEAPFVENCEKRFVHTHWGPAQVSSLHISHLLVADNNSAHFQFHSSTNYPHRPQKKKVESFNFFAVISVLSSRDEIHSWNHETISMWWNLTRLTRLLSNLIEYK